MSIAGTRFNLQPVAARDTEHQSRSRRSTRLATLHELHLAINTALLHATAGRSSLLASGEPRRGESWPK